jgi:hypothetical protein
MVIEIILNRKISIKERIKRLVAYSLSRRGVRILWKRQFKKIFMLHPTHGMHAEKSIEKAHKLYWKPFRSRINMATLRNAYGISGIANPKYIPEEIYTSDIEPTLNPTPQVEYLSNKSLYNYWFPGKIFPQDFFHNINGEWLDKDLNTIPFEQIRFIAQTLPYPVVFKPNWDSYGGKDIYFPEDFNALMNLVEKKRNFLIQEKIKQHSFFNQYNHHGLNTLRVNVYRSVSDNKLKIISMAMRMGVGGSLDNVTAGGIATRVRKDGFLNGWAIDSYGKKYLSHPDTGVDFNAQIPNLKGLHEMVLKIAGKIFYARLMSLDCCYDSEENWRMIEINLFSGSICFAQEHGALYFDEFTDEVRDYCLKNHWTLVNKPG